MIVRHLAAEASSIPASVRSPAMFCCISASLAPNPQHSLRERAGGASAIHGEHLIIPIPSHGRGAGIAGAARCARFAAVDVACVAGVARVATVVVVARVARLLRLIELLQPMNLLHL